MPTCINMVKSVCVCVRRAAEHTGDSGTVAESQMLSHTDAF